MATPSKKQLEQLELSRSGSLTFHLKSRKSMRYDISKPAVTCSQPRPSIAKACRLCLKNHIFRPQKPYIKTSLTIYFWHRKPWSEGAELLNTGNRWFFRSKKQKKSSFSFVFLPAYSYLCGRNYISAIDDLVKMPEDNPTIGLLLCRSKNNTKVEYALRGMTQPLGVAAYKTKELIENLKSSLPSIDDLEKTLNE